MNLTLLIFAAVALAALAAVPTLARDITADDRAAIASRAAELSAAMDSGDWGAILDGIPPRIVDEITTASGVSTAQLRAAMAAQMDAMLDQVQIESYRMDLDTAQAFETEDGTPYLLIPTISILAVKGTGRIQATSQTLALEDDGEWYLVRTNELAQTELVKQLFPAFRNVDFPPGSMVQLD